MSGILQQLEGIVIAHYPYGEADLSLRILTASAGKIHVIAKHARKSLRRFQGRLELLDHIQCQYKPWKEDLFVLENSTLSNSFTLLRNNFDQLIIALAGCEVCDLITRNNQPEDGLALFPLLKNFLNYLNTLDENSSNNVPGATITGDSTTAPLQFEKKLLRSLHDFIHSSLQYSGCLAVENHPVASFNSLMLLIKTLENYCDQRLNCANEIQKMAQRLRA